MAYGIDNGHQFVDLGLPSGTKWATCNVGASKPEESGDYFAWGETLVRIKNTDDIYNYRDSDGLTKYCNNYVYGKDGFVDNKIELDLTDDVANQQWGSSWRIPSKGQCEELINNTSCKWITINGVDGCLFRGINGNSIFLPAAGYRLGMQIVLEGIFGRFWLRTLNEEDPYTAYGLYFDSDDVFVNGLINNRWCGQTVRPVLECIFPKTPTHPFLFTHSM